MVFELTSRHRTIVAALHSEFEARTILADLKMWSTGKGGTEERDEELKSAESSSCFPNRPSSNSKTLHSHSTHPDFITSSTATPAPLHTPSHPSHQTTSSRTSSHDQNLLQLPALSLARSECWDGDRVPVDAAALYMHGWRKSDLSHTVPGCSSSCICGMCRLPARGIGSAEMLAWEQFVMESEGREAVAERKAETAGRRQKTLVRPLVRVMLT